MTDLSRDIDMEILQAERDEAVEMSRQMVAAYELAVEETQAAETEVEVWKRLYEASAKDRTRLREALGVIADYYESVYAPGDQAYQAAIIARAALREDA